MLLILPLSLCFSCSLKSSGRLTTGIRHSILLPSTLVSYVHGYNTSTILFVLKVPVKYPDVYFLCCYNNNTLNSVQYYSIITAGEFAGLIRDIAGGSKGGGNPAMAPSGLSMGLGPQPSNIFTTQKWHTSYFVSILSSFNLTQLSNP